MWVEEHRGGGVVSDSVDHEELWRPCGTFENFPLAEAAQSCFRVRFGEAEFDLFYLNS